MTSLVSFQSRLKIHHLAGPSEKLLDPSEGLPQLLDKHSSLPQNEDSQVADEKVNSADANMSDLCPENDPTIDRSKEWSSSTFDFFAAASLYVAGIVHLFRLYFKVSIVSGIRFNHK